VLQYERKNIIRATHIEILCRCNHLYALLKCITHLSPQPGNAHGSYSADKLIAFKNSKLS